MTDKTPPVLHGKLSLDTAMGAFLGDTRIKLLEAIALHGSISQAAKTVPLSYKAAWDAIDAMNNLAPEPLVIRTTGGKHGGGTELTAYGRRLIGFYRALEAEHQAALARLVGDEVADFRQLLKRMSMKSSARNQFAGPIVGIKEGIVECEVCVRLDEQLNLVAVITRESAENLGLKVGKEVSALVKSSSVLLMRESDTRISARNRFCGEVSRIHEGPVNTEVSIMLPGGRYVVTAVITHESLEKLELKQGVSACAVFKASSVLLAVTE